MIINTDNILTGVLKYLFLTVTIALKVFSTINIKMRLFQQKFGKNIFRCTSFCENSTSV